MLSLGITLTSTCLTTLDEGQGQIQAPPPPPPPPPSPFKKIMFISNTNFPHVGGWTPPFFFTPRRACTARGQVIALGLDSPGSTFCCGISLHLKGSMGPNISSISLLGTLGPGDRRLCMRLVLVPQGRIGGGGLRPPPFQVNKMRNIHFGQNTSEVPLNFSMQRHYCMNLTALIMKRGRY